MWTSETCWMRCIVLNAMHRYTDLCVRRLGWWRCTPCCRSMRPTSTTSATRIKGWSTCVSCPDAPRGPHDHRSIRRIPCAQRAESGASAPCVIALTWLCVSIMIHAQQLTVTWRANCVGFSVSSGTAESTGMLAGWRGTEAAQGIRSRHEGSRGYHQPAQLGGHDQRDAQLGRGRSAVQLPHAQLAATDAAGERRPGAEHPRTGNTVFHLHLRAFIVGLPHNSSGD